MRPEEEFVANRLALHLGLDRTEAIAEGEDPPDFYLTVGDAIHAVEVTRLAPIVVGADGNIRNRRSEDEFGVELCESLDANEGGRLPEEFSLLLHLRVPVTNGARYKRDLRAQILRVIEHGPVPDRVIIPIAEAQIALSWIPRQTSGKRIVGIVENTDARPEIFFNARLILQERVAAKHAICEPLSGTHEIWLALLNDYWLADARTYRHALGAYDRPHCFDRIWLISDTGVVDQLK